MTLNADHPVGKDRRACAASAASVNPPAEPRYPAGSRAAPLVAGSDVALPLGTRLDSSVGEERIVGLFCASAIELEPLRAALERSALPIPDGCQVTRWSFVKR